MLPAFGQQIVKKLSMLATTLDFMRTLVLTLLCTSLWAQQAITFGKVNGQPLTWKTVGDGLWHQMADGTLVGQRDLIGQGPRKAYETDARAFRGWLDRQAWLYTDNEYSDFTFEADYWLREGGNSGIALRDPSRAAAGVQAHPDFSKTPSKVAYEIQLNNRYPDPEISGAIYKIAPAKPVAVKYPLVILDECPANQQNEFAPETEQPSPAITLEMKVTGGLIASLASSGAFGSDPDGLALKPQNYCRAQSPTGKTIWYQTKAGATIPQWILPISITGITVGGMPGPTTDRRGRDASIGVLVVNDWTRRDRKSVV